MKVTSVEIHPAGSSSIAVLSFRDPRRLNRFNVKGILGLDAEDITPRYYGVSGTSNNKFYSLSLEKREIAMQIELNPDYGSSQTYSDLRDILYKMISSSRTGIVELQFKNGTTVVAVVSGFVSKFENSLFDKNPGIQIKIACTEPMLKAPTRQNLNILVYNPASTNIVDNLSTAPHGFLFEIGFLSALPALLVAPPDNSWSFSVEPPGGFIESDVVHFSSELNNKYLYVLRAGVIIQLAESISSGSVWPILFPGDNVFEFANDTVLVWEKISFYPTYWGV